MSPACSFSSLPVAAAVAKILKSRKQRIAVVEATTAGLISAQLVAQSGASAFFISSIVVYTGRGAKQLLPATILKQSGLFDRESNYKSRDLYVESKVKFCSTVAKEMRSQVKADWIIVESGTSGPEFYIPGVEVGFTAVGVSNPKGETKVRVFHSTSRDRVANMEQFTSFALDFLLECMNAEQNDEARL